MLLPFKNWLLNVLVSLVEFEGSFYSVLRPQVRKLFIRSAVGGSVPSVGGSVVGGRWVGGRWFYNNPCYIDFYYVRTINNEIWNKKKEYLVAHY